MRDPSDEPRLIEWLGYTRYPRFGRARLFGTLLGFIMAVLFVVIVLLAIIAAGTLLWRTISQGVGDSIAGNLGAGTLIVAIISSPFLLWSTVIKQQTVDFQKEGHMTDRIAKAVEQLGAEKDVTRLMRTVSYTLDGTPVSKFEGREDVPLPDGAADILLGDWQVVSRSTPNIEVRIGALLSLERISQDSVRFDQGRDHVRVMEIICAYIRENAPASESEKHPFGPWERGSVEAGESIEDARRERFGDPVPYGQVWEWAQTLGPPRTDVMLALQIIGRRGKAQKTIEARWGPKAQPDAIWPFYIDDHLRQRIKDGAPVDQDLSDLKARIASYKGYRVDLRDTCLQGADLRELDFGGARLDGSVLDSLWLDKSNCTGAVFDDASMNGIDFSAVDACCCQLIYSSLENADLSGALLCRAIFLSSKIIGSDLRNTKFQYSGFVDTDFEGSNLSGANFTGASQVSLRLEGTTTTGTTGLTSHRPHTLTPVPRPSTPPCT